MLVVDIADLKITDDSKEVIITYSLGSCIGVSIYDPEIKTGGILHCMLPLSKIDREKSKTNPYMFADTGMIDFLNRMYRYGAKKSNLIIKVAGGSRILDEKQLFNIGEKNYTICRKILWKNDLLITGENIGGSVPRTLSLNIETGKSIVKIKGHEYNL